MTITELRTERNQRLAASDYQMLPDIYNTFSVGDQVVLTQYRQALRDLPALYEGQDPLPETIDWPEVPFTVTEESEESE